MFDLIIKNVKIIDGTAAPWFYGAVAVKDGIIQQVGRFISEGAKEVVDGNGAVLSPGFIDIHSHSDKTIMYYPQAESRILQGVTTEFGGNCGVSTAPVSRNAKYRKLLCESLNRDQIEWETLGEFLCYVEKCRPSVNFGMGVGHSTLRIAAMGYEKRQAGKTEIQCMRGMLKQAFEEGAFFLSSGLIYAPGCYADYNELASLTEEVKKANAFYATHMRSEGKEIVKALDEALATIKETRVPLQISHHKVTWREGWGTLSECTISKVREANDSGLDVTMDQYPYCASATSLYTCLPVWSYEGGIGELATRLDNIEYRMELEKILQETHGRQWENIYVSYVNFEKNQWMIGLSIKEIADKLKQTAENTCLTILAEEQYHAKIIKYCISEDDVQFIMKQPFSMIGSDGSASSFVAFGKPHPRSFGTFARVIRKYYREEHVIPLEMAIYKMTGFPAARLGLNDRGLIKPGYWADLVLFDENEIYDTPDFNVPRQACDGILRVYVNGVLTALNGIHTGARAGIILRKNIDNR